MVIATTMPPVRVTAKTHMRKVGGGSQSHLLLADDGNLYVVKFYDNPQHHRLLANEWLATHLALHLGLPVALPAIVAVPEQFVDAYPELTFSRSGKSLRYRPGLHYGSRFVGGLFPGRAAVDYLPSTMMSTVVNVTDFWGALVFDKWTCNVDARQAVFHPKRRGSYVATFIDHGMCFNAEEWHMVDIRRQGCYRRSLVYSRISGLDSFATWLARLDTLDSATMWCGFQNMPEAWYGGDLATARLLIDALDRRRTRVPQLLRDLRDAQPEHFPLWL